MSLPPDLLSLLQWPSASRHYSSHPEFQQGTQALLLLLQLMVNSPTHTKHCCPLPHNLSFLLLRPIKPLQCGHFSRFLLTSSPKRLSSHGTSARSRCSWHSWKCLKLCPVLTSCRKEKCWEWVFSCLNICGSCCHRSPPQQALTWDWIRNFSGADLVWSYCLAKIQHLVVQFSTFPVLLNTDGLAAEPLLLRAVALIAQREAACNSLHTVTPYSTPKAFHWKIWHPQMTQNYPHTNRDVISKSGWHTVFPILGQKGGFSIQWLLCCPVL